MSMEKKSPGAVAAASRAEVDSTFSHDDTKRPTPKVWRGVALLSTGNRVNRWDAASLIRDSCWNSTVAEMEARLGLRISREETVVRGYQGEPTRCKSYWLDPEQREKAKRMLQQRKGDAA